MYIALHGRWGREIAGGGRNIKRERRETHYYGPRIDYKIQSCRQKRRRKMIEKIIDLFAFHFLFCFNEI